MKTSSMLLSTVLLVSGISLAIAPCAMASAASPLKVSGAYVKSIPDSTTNTAVYLVINNSSAQEPVLVGVSSKAARAVEIHGHTEKDGMMKMEKVDQVIIPANGSVEFKPMGLHIMLIDLTPKARKAKNVELTLHFKDQSSLKVKAPYRGAEMEMHSHGSI